MRKSAYLKIVGSTFFLASLVFFGFFQNNQTQQEDFNRTEIPAESALSSLKPDQQPAPSQALEKNPSAKELTEEENPFEGQEVKARLQQVAEQFAEEIKYPTFSKPIRNQHELSKYLPNRSISSSLPINLLDVNAAPVEDGPRISLKTSKFKYYDDETIAAEAKVSGLEAINTVSVSAYAMADRKIITRASEVTETSTDAHPNDHHYRIEFGDINHSDLDHSGDIDVVAEFTIDGQIYQVSSLVRYPTIVASLDRIGSAEVQEEYLVIPAFINTTSPGIHAVSGNLYDAKSGTPLVHLNAIEELGTESDVIFLKAHIAALKKMGYEGPYELKDISLARGPSAPDYVSAEGLVDFDSVAVTGFPFSDYQDIPYIDERAQARLEFLTQLGSTN